MMIFRTRSHSVLVIVVALYFYSPAKASENVESILARAESHFSERNFGEAIKHFRYAAEKDPVNRAAHQGLVKVLLKNGNTEEARSAAEATFQILKSSAVPHTLMGHVHFQAGDFKAAKNSYLEALKYSDATAQNHVGLGKVLWSECSRKTALEHFRKAFALDPEEPEVVRYWTLAAPDWEQRSAAYDKYAARATYEEPDVLAYWKSRASLTQYLRGRHTFRLESKPERVVLTLASVKSGPQYPIYGLRLKATFNGKETLDLLLDTGASGLLIRERTAEKAGVKRIVDSLIRGIGDEGSRQSYFGWVDSIRTGALEFKDCVVTVSDRKNFGPDVSGIIGTDVFKEFLLKLDYAGRTLELTRLPEIHGVSGEQDWITINRTLPAQMLDYLPVRIVGGKLIVETRVNDKRDGNFLIDSGAADNFIAEKLARGVTSLDSIDARVQGISGKINKVYRVPEVTLQFGQFRQVNRDIVAFDFSSLSKAMETEIGGLLGHRILQHFVLAIDYRDGLIKFIHRKQ